MAGLDESSRIQRGREDSVSTPEIGEREEQHPMSVEIGDAVPG